MINFVIVAAIIYFVVVLPLKAMLERGEVPEESPVPTDEALLLAEIRDELRARRL
jgi:large conductance mechanosensitive channel